MQRRDFLRLAGIAGMMPWVAACARAFTPSLGQMSAPSGDVSGAEKDPEGIWREGVAYARWTPSPHNIQPWRVRLISKERAELYYDPRRLLPVTDPTSAFTSAGMAMFVEYLSAAVAPRGYAVRPEYFGKPLDYSAQRPQLFANLSLVPRTRSAPDRNLILQRKTSRLPYDGTPVGEDALQALGRLAGEHGHAMHASSDPALVEWMLDLNRYTLFEDLDDDPARKELRGWIRVTDEEAAGSRDGLWYHCLRMPGWLLKSFFDRHEKYRSGWRRDLCGKLLMREMRGTRTVAWWSGPIDRPEDWTRSGSLLARSWLEMASRGVQMHPFGSVITNTKAYGRLVEKVGEPDGVNRVWFLARLGRSDEAPRSYRLEVSSIFLDDRELT